MDSFVDGVVSFAKSTGLNHPDSVAVDAARTFTSPSGQRRLVREMVIQRADAGLGVAPDLVERRRGGAVGGEPTVSRLKQLASGPGRRHRKFVRYRGNLGSDVR